MRVGVDGAIKHLDELLTEHVDVTFAKELLVVVDRLVVGDGGAQPPRRRARHRLPRGRRRRRGAVHRPGRLADRRSARHAPALHRALRVPERRHHEPRRRRRSSSRSTSRAAPARSCNGFGAMLEYDESLIVPYPERTLRDGAIDPWTKPRYDNKRRALAEFAKREGISMDAPWSELPAKAREQPAARERRTATRASSPSSTISRRSATSSTSASSSGSTRRRRNVRPATAPSSSRKR